MKNNTEGTENDTIVLERPLTGPLRAPVRVAFGFLSSGTLLWFLFFICIPVGLLVAAITVDSRIAGVAVGLSGLFLLGFWWISYRYMNPRLTVNPTRRTIRIDHGQTPAWTQGQTIDLDDLRAVVIVPFHDYALVRLDYTELNVFGPQNFLVSRSDLSIVIDTLEATDVDISTFDRSEVPWWRSLEIPLRIILTPLVLITIPAYAVWVFGTGALRSDTVIITGLIALWTVQVHLTTAAGLRPRHRYTALVFDIVLTVLLLLGAFWVYVQLR